jgi:hypothetical protein
MVSGDARHRRDESEWVPTLTKCWPFSNPSENTPGRASGADFTQSHAKCPEHNAEQK